MNYLTIAKWVGAVIGGLVIAWAIYAGVIRPVTKPNPTTTNKADVIYNYTITPRHTFGCSAFLIRREKDGKQEIQLDNKEVVSSPDSVNSGSNPI